MKEAISYPVRLNRYLAQKGIATRREADEIIRRGHVAINGVIAKIGTQVREEDVVEVKESELHKNTLRYRYIAYHKPRGMVTDAKNITSVPRALNPALRGIFPLGRLDKDSHGLLILTNDGRLTDRLLHPSNAHEKEYFVHVDKPVTDKFIRRLKRGITIEGYRTRPAQASRAGETVFRIVLTEGKKHQIRRMCTAEGFQVRDLKRTRIMNIELNDLKEGTYRSIEGNELTTLLKKVGL